MIEICGSILCRRFRILWRDHPTGQFCSSWWRQRILHFEFVFIGNPRSVFSWINKCQHHRDCCSDKPRVFSQPLANVSRIAHVLKQVESQSVKQKYRTQTGFAHQFLFIDAVADFRAQFQVPIVIYLETTAHKISCCQGLWDLSITIHDAHVLNVELICCSLLFCSCRCRRYVDSIL